MTILPDVLKPNLTIVFCGMAASTKSANLGAYYAGIGNKFWKTLFEIGLTSIKLSPNDYALLFDYSIGLTDLVKGQSGNDAAVIVTTQDIETLKSKILHYQPRIIAFTGKRSAEKFLNCKVEYGLQKQQIGQTKIFVLPSTSLQANRYWEISYWKDFRDFVKTL